LTDKSRKEILIDLIALTSVDGIGPNRLQQLIGSLGSAEKVLQSPISQLEEVAGISRKVASCIHENQNRTEAEKYVDKIIEFGWKYYIYTDDDYPAPLKNIAEKPPYLFYLGKYIIEDHNAIAIVGSRTASESGKLFAEQLAAALAENHITVISGMARGIDTCVHRGALKAGGRTLAVFGSSLDIIYPPEGRKMAEQIINKGCIFSEYLPGTEPYGPNFPKRNRIISGLSQGVVVIEAAERSGALSTAGHALAQNREVFAVPGSPRSSTSRGTNKLIKDGAMLLTSVEDIFEALPRLKGQAVAGQAKNLSQLTSTEKSLIELFADEPIHIDNLSRLMKTPITDLMPILLALELKGIIKELSGKRYIISME
jgi:DNA processing protein